MKTSTSIKQFKEMYNKLANPEERAKAKRQNEIDKRKEEKIKDWGL